MSYNSYPEEFDWDAVPVEIQPDARVWGGTILRMAGGAEVRINVPHTCVRTQSAELDA